METNEDLKLEAYVISAIENIGSEILSQGESLAQDRAGDPDVYDTDAAQTDVLKTVCAFILETSPSIYNLTPEYVEAWLKRRREGRDSKLNEPDEPNIRS